MNREGINMGIMYGIKNKMYSMFDCIYHLVMWFLYFQNKNLFTTLVNYIKNKINKVIKL